MMKEAILFLFISISGLAAQAQDSYPTPPDLYQRLFYIQRTGSSNTVVYDAKFGPDGKFKPEQPIDVYWLRYSDYGQRVDLNYLQRTLAYGVKAAQSDIANEYIFHLVSYSQRKFRLKLDAQGKPVAVILINGKEAYLKRVFLEHEDALFGLRPIIHYVEIFGVDAKTGKAVYERFVP